MRNAWLLGVAAGLGLFVGVASTAAQTLRVRGASHFVGLHVEATSDNLRVVGRLVDDTGAALSQQLVSAQDSGQQLAPCTVHSNTTDERGAFCFALNRAPVESSSVHFSGNAYVEGTSAGLAATTRDAVELSMKLPATRLLIGSDPAGAEITLSALARNVDEQPTYASLLLRVLVSAGNEPGRQLPAPSHIRVGETVKVPLHSTLLGAPGLRHLEVGVESVPGTLVTQTSAEFEVVAPVRLEWKQLPKAASPDEELELEVAVSAPGGVVSEGWIELLSNDESTSISPVEAGAARVKLPPDRSPAAATGSWTLRARYLPATSAFEASADIEAVVAVGTPPWWRHLPWVVLALGSAWWVLRGWARPLRKAAPRAETPGSGRGGVHVVRHGGPAKGWRGHIVDAHSGIPIAGAVLELRIPSLDARAASPTVRSAEDGSFQLPPIGARPEGARLRISAPDHSTRLDPLPPEGQVLIRLVARRRTLLGALQRWTEARGVPWIRPGGATPRDVMTRAQARGDEAIHAWAARIEEASFGSAVPTPEVESELLRQVPPADDVGR